MPNWLLKFIPANFTGVFVEDEVTLLMRQDPSRQQALQRIESDDMFVMLMEMYQQSRLSELSRPKMMRVCTLLHTLNIHIYIYAEIKPNK
jgi:hypothetical protein